VRGKLKNKKPLERCKRRGYGSEQCLNIVTAIPRVVVAVLLFELMFGKIVLDYCPLLFSIASKSDDCRQP